MKLVYLITSFIFGLCICALIFRNELYLENVSFIDLFIHDKQRLLRNRMSISSFSSLLSNAILLITIQPWTRNLTINELFRSQNDKRFGHIRIADDSIRKQQRAHKSVVTLCDFHFNLTKSSDPPLVATIRDKTMIHSFCNLQNDDSGNNNINTRIRLKRNFNYFTVYNDSLHVNAKDENALFQLEFQGTCLDSDDFTHVGIEIMSPHAESSLQVNVGYLVTHIKGNNICVRSIRRENDETMMEYRYGSVHLIPQTNKFETIKVSISSTIEKRKSNNNNTMMIYNRIRGNHSSSIVSKQDSYKDRKDHRRRIVHLSFIPKVNTEIIIRSLALIRKVKCRN